MTRHISTPCHSGLSSKTVWKAVLSCANVIWAVLLLEQAISAADRSETLPIPIGQQRELFVDKHLVETLHSLALKPHYPEAQEVVLVCDQPWEGNVSGYYTFIEDDDRFRVYYRGAHFDPATKKITHEVTCYAESKDGIHWVKPKLGLFEFQGSKENNIVMIDGKWKVGVNDHVAHNFTPFKDTNPNCPPNARYKALGGEKSGLIGFQSADGIHWEKIRPEPVITDGYFDSQNLAFWDPNKKCYVSYTRDFRNKKIRDIKLATSDDFLNWTSGEYLKYGEAPEEHLYTNAVRPYFRAPQLYLGFPTRYQPKTEQVEPILMTSRDGLHFHRWEEPLIPITAPKDREGNRSNYMAHGLIQVPGQDREISVFGTEAYYAGPASRVRRFTFRTDGFVSVHADREEGELITPPVKFSGKQLSLNYAAQPGGELRVEIQSQDGKPLKGFSLEDCTKLSGDEINQTVEWAGGSDLSAVASQPVRLRFVLRNADLYALKFNP